MTVCKFAQVNYKFVNVITNSKSAMDEYKKVNPAGHIPMLEHRDFKVYGGNHLIFVYLCHAYQAEIGN